MWPGVPGWMPGSFSDMITTSSAMPALSTRSTTRSCPMNRRVMLSFASRSAADLAGVDFSGAYLRGSLMVNALLTDAGFEKADLRQAVLHLGPVSEADLPDGVELLVDGDATFESILRGIDDAEAYILVQFYIVRDDGLGRALKDRQGGTPVPSIRRLRRRC